MPFLDDLRQFGPDASYEVSRAEAWAYCARLTATHYENFSVATWLTPRPLRPAFQSIYALLPVVRRPRATRWATRPAPGSCSPGGAAS